MKILFIVLMMYPHEGGKHEITRYGFAAHEQSWVEQGRPSGVLLTGPMRECLRAVDALWYWLPENRKDSFLCETLTEQSRGR